MDRRSFFKAASAVALGAVVGKEAAQGKKPDLTLIQETVAKGGTVVYGAEITGTIRTRPRAPAYIVNNIVTGRSSLETLKWERV